MRVTQQSCLNSLFLYFTHLVNSNTVLLLLALESGMSNGSIYLETLLQACVITNTCFLYSTMTSCNINKANTAVFSCAKILQSMFIDCSVSYSGRNHTNKRIRDY